MNCSAEILKTLLEKQRSFKANIPLDGEGVLKFISFTVFSHPENNNKLAGVVSYGLNGQIYIQEQPVFFNLPAPNYKKLIEPNFRYFSNDFLTVVWKDAGNFVDKQPIKKDAKISLDKQQSEDASKLVNKQPSRNDLKIDVKPPSPKDFIIDVKPPGINDLNYWKPDVKQQSPVEWKSLFKQQSPVDPKTLVFNPRDAGFFTLKDQQDDIEIKRENYNINLSYGYV